MAAKTQCVPGVGSAVTCHSNRLFSDRSYSDRLYSNRGAQLIVGPILQARASSLYVKARVEHHPCNQDKQ
jgi:hypothetical protein